MTDNVKILLAGEGGQGIQTIAKILTDVAIAENKKVNFIPSFGVEQRGTPSVAFITIGEKEIHYPRFYTADYVVLLQTRAIKAVEEYISPNTKVIFDSSTIDVDDLPKKAVHRFGIPATKYAYEKFNPRTFNIIVLGKISKILNLDEKTTHDTIFKMLGKKFKTKEIEQQNNDAYYFGREAVFEFDTFTKATFVPKHGEILLKGFGKKGKIVPDRCKGCGICIYKCPVGALKQGAELGVFATPVPECDLEKCIACGNCWRFCPDGAILIQKEEA
jgi:2-oxoglutarate ferredoxin oxidoreductase subunit gamma